MDNEYLRLCSIVEENGQLTLVDTPRVCNHVNTIHAGALFSLARASLARCLHLSSAVTPKAQYAVRYVRPAKGNLQAQTTSVEGIAHRYITTITNANQEVVATVEASLEEVGHA